MIISLENIEKTYDRPVLKNVSYQFETGKLYVIKGVSGSGKSTLLNIIGGVEQNFKGNICFDGINVKEVGKQRPGSGYVFQYSLLLSHLTILENLLLIKNDLETIMKLSSRLGVEELLQKNSDQISGGERQRISVIRALLLNPPILLADEPTASLDEENAALLADLLASLKNKDRVIIVATHESYFDEFADEILYLNYGEIQRIEKKEGQTYNDLLSVDLGVPCSAGRRESVDYNLKRNPKLLSFFNTLPFIIIFLLILFISTVQENFDNIYMENVKERYPVDAFNIYEFELEEFAYKNQVEFYDYYIAEENGVTAYYLADYKDSVLAAGGMIEFGVFPEREDEIIVSHEFMEQCYGVQKTYEQYIGETLIFKNKKFTIAGILYSMDAANSLSQRADSFDLYYNSDIYYQGSEGVLIYIPYQQMKSLADPIDTDVKRAYIRDLYDQIEVAEALRKAMVSDSINVFDGEIMKAQQYVDIISGILLLVFIVCFLMACIFMTSQIQIELFYRKKELGFLQIFGLSKKRIRSMVFSGYCMKIGAGFIRAILLYAVAEGIYFMWSRHIALANPIHAGAVFGGIFVFYLIFTAKTIKGFLKQDVIQLIAED